MVYGYKTKKSAASGPDGQVKLLVAEPTDKVGPLPGVLWIHGGGYVVVEELILEMSEGFHSNVGAIAFTVGFVLMMALDVTLG